MTFLFPLVDLLAKEARQAQGRARGAEELPFTAAEMADARGRTVAAAGHGIDREPALAARTRSLDGGSLVPDQNKRERDPHPKPYSCSLPERWV